MTQNATIGYRRDVAFENVQISTANSRGVYLHNDVGSILDLRIRHLFPLFLTWTVINYSLHKWLLLIVAWHALHLTATLGTARDGVKTFEEASLNLPNLNRSHDIGLCTNDRDVAFGSPMSLEFSASVSSKAR